MATKKEQQAKAREEAALILSEEDYLKLIEAIDKGKEVMFNYNKLSGGTWLYRAVKPVGFAYAGKVYFWGEHKIHNRGHSFRAWELSEVYVYGNIIEALININKYYRFWNGMQAGITTIRI